MGLKLEGGFKLQGHLCTVQNGGRGQGSCEELAQNEASKQEVAANRPQL